MSARIVKPMLWVVAFIALTVVALWLGQRRLIYLPDRSSPPAPPPVEEVTLLSDDGLELTAWWLPGAGNGTVVVFPGNAGNRQHRLPLAEALVERGPGVLLVDYRGYGGNPGRPSEAGLLADARAVGAWLEAQDLDHVVYLGESLGAGPATYLATQLAPDGLVLRSPFPDLATVAAVHYPLLPVSLLLRDHFPIPEWLESVDAPVRVVAGDADTIVPLEHSLAVAEAAGGDLVVVAGANHNDPMLGWGAEVVEAVLTVGR